MSDLHSEVDVVDRYFLQLFESAWAGVEMLLTKSQIENDVTIGFISGIFVASALACIEDDHLSEWPKTVQRRKVLYERLGGLPGVIGELIRRMEFDWQYVALDDRTQEDWNEPDLMLTRSEDG